MPLMRPLWTEQQFQEDSEWARELFREERMQEPLEQYLEVFDQYRSAVETLIESTVDLSQLSDQAIELLIDPNILMAVRFLASPPISHDDLKVLAEATISAHNFRRNPAVAKRVVEIVMLGLDRNRFPWVGEDREPTAAERDIAVVSTSSLIATERLRTLRRNSSKDTQEEAVKERLRLEGYREVEARVVTNYSQTPAPGTFCRESEFAGRKADIILRLWDGRTMPIECKVSNSSTNSVKRLNNDAAAKAKTWILKFGTENVVPVAVLAGVFNVKNLKSAQDDGLSIIWGHNLDALIEFVEATRP